MDRRSFAVLGLFLTVMGAASGVAQNTDAPLRELGWISEQGQLAAATTQPGDPTATAERGAVQSDLQIAGEIAFHTPALLGGQAAKAGISCASCHVNGRDNPHFQFQGVSGDPGTADVTHSFFSSHRGDGKFNPIAIPDLTKPGKIDRDAKGEMETFVRGLIVEEFNGEEPAAETLGALAAYVRALCNECARVETEITLQTHWSRVAKGIRAAKSIQPQSPELVDLLLAGSMHQLGLVNERFAGKPLAPQRAKLVTLAAQIQAMRDYTRAKQAIPAARFEALSEEMDRLEEHLVPFEKQSLYNRDVLAAMIEGGTDNHR